MRRIAGLFDAEGSMLGDARTTMDVIDGALREYVVRAMGLESTDQSTERIGEMSGGGSLVQALPAKVVEEIVRVLGEFDTVRFSGMPIEATTVYAARVEVQRLITEAQAAQRDPAAVTSDAGVGRDA